MYVEATPRIKELQRIVRPFRATCKKEDRGDHFKDETPDEVVEYEKEIYDFYNAYGTDSNGKLLI